MVKLISDKFWLQKMKIARTFNLKHLISREVEPNPSRLVSNHVLIVFLLSTLCSIHFVCNFMMQIKVLIENTFENFKISPFHILTHDAICKITALLINMQILSLCGVWPAGWVTLFFCFVVAWKQTNCSCAVNSHAYSNLPLVAVCFKTLINRVLMIILLMHVFYKWKCNVLDILFINLLCITDESI